MTAQNQIAGRQDQDQSQSLPSWDLTDLYEGPDSPRLKADLDRLRKDAEAFREDNLGRVAELPAAEFAAAIAAYEGISEAAYKVMAYAQLLHAGDTLDPVIGGFYQDSMERVNTITSSLLFFTLEINKLTQERLDELLADPAVDHYRPWLRDVRLFREHELPETLERLLHEREVAGRAAWVRLFDETLAAMKVPVEGADLSLTQALDRLSDRDRDRREAAARAVGAALAANGRLFAHVTNTLAKDKEIDDRWRKYPHPQSLRNLANRVEDEVVQALVDAVRDAFPRLSHRYYRMKARWMGLEKLAYWDRNAPLPEDSDRRYGWDEAREMVLSSFGRFSPEMADIAGRFFTENWIDAPVRHGKTSGAFSHPVVPSAHPYILVNFMGRARDVMTLAHELGHGVHQMLAAPRGLLMSDTPLTLAETASVFGEMLTFRSLLDAETDPVRRRIMIAGKVEDMLNTVVRQIAFHGFEEQVHRRRRDGEIPAETLCDLWMEVQSTSLGDAFEFDASYRYYWAYISHFLHAPFYVYAYAFGDCLVNSLYAVHAEGGLPDFQDRYKAMLAAGGTLRHKELLAPFGLDASDPRFWRRGLTMIEGLIDELEKLEG